ncbi:bifunctional ADP-dependent NAD(P)H-hydrate dehydratase/NAD(P)H-hydrate epimerase [Pseudomonas daroniae]|uniref:Bifunctional NAD(P)H-hydrate repair enzyme n=1 Tax=Phytopseudomonas daroniae TaxID=2487519 RepID=A0A4Q9QRW0_9GAMM|nr:MULTISPECIES: NAD(P)H-hydrate dehydratase [Pseudomonas]TBU83074.1 bifunctional ADP-dependent NAD(P)H-hydrate dehydratase/NAD(P)H-hydrate epimerase [Pseudomonas sp. FRB 228]TBU83913.1 bifunctional ADP-dependent NAD(P)H-hydrate dehydratase/NAD(P)H-hydrate epimerase [Pseudomonas daroniae]TBU93090.1 bifunctional ADP-dependent NAD(P)H-hydrate dehydratase/NAD(P)H-hydrate epimerase [Pseudomonas daroniae]
MRHSSDDLPIALYSAAQVRGLDARLIAAGTPGFVLMQRAAHAIWRALRRNWPDAGAITVLAGHGNNAGDGYLVAALALRAGWQVRLLAVAEPQRLQGDAALARDEALAAGVEVLVWEKGLEPQGVLVDALLGTGLAGAVREPYADAIRWINGSDYPVLAVDIPSGICADTGQVLGVAVKARLTVTLIGLKIGLFVGQALDHVGRLTFDDLQADAATVADQQSVAQRLAGHVLPRVPARQPTTHKGRLGHVLVVGGDHGTGGAALLSAQSALRGGAGMVSLATRAEHIGAAQTRLPEVMSLAVASANQLHDIGSKITVWVVGPGLGQNAWARSLLSAASASSAAQVWDADALNLLAAGVVSIEPGNVITPHPGEAARLLGISTQALQADRPAAARALAQRYRVICVLKGAGTLIADPAGHLLVCDRGDPVMAGAGLGDVLAGLIGALIAQGCTPWEAASLGVWLHAGAGEYLAGKGNGLAASDLCDAIRHLLQERAACPK